MWTKEMKDKSSIYLSSSHKMRFCSNLSMVRWCIRHMHINHSVPSAWTIMRKTELNRQHSLLLFNAVTFRNLQEESLGLTKQMWVDVTLSLECGLWSSESEISEQQDLGLSVGKKRGTKQDDHQLTYEGATERGPTALTLYAANECTLC